MSYYMRVPKITRRESTPVWLVHGRLPQVSVSTIWFGCIPVLVDRSRTETNLCFYRLADALRYPAPPLHQVGESSVWLRTSVTRRRGEIA